MPTCRFTLHDRLAQGGSGSVWTLEPLSDAVVSEVPVATLDLDTSLGSGPWVVKVAHDASGRDASVALAHEATNQLRSAGPGVAVVGGLVDVHFHGAESAVVPGLVLQRLDGTRLDVLLSRDGPNAAVVADETPAPGGIDVVTGLSALARLIGRVHAAGVVHGDVAPGNVLVDATGVALVDFGSSLPVAAVASEPGVVATGTLGFVAPEVVAGESTTTAGDVFGVGALGKYWLAASPGLDERRRDIVAAWCADLTAWSPAARPDDLDTAAQVLDALCGSAAPLARTVEFGPRPPRPEPDRDAASRRFSTRAALAVTSLVAVCLVGVLGVVARRSDAPSLVRGDTVVRAGDACHGDGRVWELHDGQTRYADVLGVGCAQRVHWSHRVLAVTRSDHTRAAVTQRFAIGKPGDVTFLGTWECAPHLSLSLYRPATGEILAWQTLPATPGADRGIAPRRHATGIVDGHVQVAYDRRGCAHLRVTETNG